MIDLQELLKNTVIIREEISIRPRAKVKNKTRSEKAKEAWASGTYDHCKYQHTGRKHTEESKAKMRAQKLGKTKTEEHRIRISVAKSNYYNMIHQIQAAYTCTFREATIIYKYVGFPL